MTSGNKIVDRIGGTNNGASDDVVSHVRVCLYINYQLDALIIIYS